MKRGRVSAAALSIAKPIEILERPRAPHDLTDEETEIWAGIVSSEPADWFFASSMPLLAQYCRHIAHARRVAELLEKATGNSRLKIADYDRLLKMQERESRAIASLATKMRISPQSIRNHRGNKAPTISRPWEG